MNRKKKPNEEVKMSTGEVIRRLVRDARPIYGWLLLGALLGGIVVACPEAPGPGYPVAVRCMGRRAPQSRPD